MGDVGPAIRSRDPVERSNALLRTQSHAKDSKLVSGSSVFIAFDFTSATPLRTKAYVGTPLVTRCIPLYTLRIGRHTNTISTIGRQALVERPLLSATLLVFLLYRLLAPRLSCCLFQCLSHCFHRWCLHLC